MAKEKKPVEVNPPNMISRISMRDIGMNKTAIQTLLVDVKDGGRVLLANIGMISGKVQLLETDTGPFYEFSGKVRAKNVVSGVEFEGAKCILPNVVGDLVAEAIISVGEQSDLSTRNCERKKATLLEEHRAKGGARVAFEIYAFKDAQSATGYRYTAVNMFRESEDTDPLAELMALAFNPAAQIEG